MFVDRIAPEFAKDNPLWLIVLCDLMTNMMLFFMILFAFAQQGEVQRERLARAMRGQAVDEEKTEAQKKAEKVLTKVEESQVANALERLIEQDKLKAGLVVTDEKISIELPSPALFKSGQADLSHGVERELAPVAQILSRASNMVLIEGHTDNVKTGANSPYRSNWLLSAARASRVADYFSKTGVPSSRIIIAGYGEFKPAASNESPEGRARNRRIEIHVLRKNEKKK